MIYNCMGFTETMTGFYPDNFEDEINWDIDAKTLLVKAHERYVYKYNDKMIMTKIHRDNGGDYHFSKLDFLSHKLQEIIFPHMEPILYAADFTDELCPSFILEKVELDELHKAYNILHQNEHIRNGQDYRYNINFFDIGEDIDLQEKANQHIEKIKVVQKQYKNSINKFGLAFDHAFVNMTWRNGLPVALEMHKCLRNYLFNYDKCLDYFSNHHRNSNEKDIALNILKRIKELLNSSNF